MEGVGGVVAVVAEFVDHYFVGGEVAEVLGVEADDLVYGEEEGGFGELAGVQTVFEVAVGADGEGDVHLGVVCPEVMEGGFEGFDAFLLAHAVLTKVA